MLGLGVFLALFVPLALSTVAAAQNGAAYPADGDAALTVEGDGLSILASPLAPAPTTSPRQTFQSFRALTQQASDFLMEAIETSAQNDAILDTPELRTLKAAAVESLDKAASTLDLSGIAPASRRTVGISSALLLDEIMDRIPLPEIDEIPDEADIDAGAAPNGWTLPGTEIRMARIEGPDGEPRFVFSAETISHLAQFYSQVRALPRHSDDRIDFYQSFVVGPGLSMPIELYRYVLELPPWMLRVYLEQAVWQWLAFAALTLVVGVVAFFLLRAEVGRQRSANAAIRSLQLMLPAFLIIALLALYHWLNADVIHLTGSILADVELAVVVLQALASAVIAVLAFNAVAALIVALPRIGKETLDASLIRLVLRVLGIGVAGYILFQAAARVGIPLYGIIASLGVGGLALALAVRPTLENFIGGIILYADRPVKVGDFCKFGDMLGTVEAIGLRSTKVRGLDRTLVTVQNAEFAQMSITNFTRRDSNLMNAQIGLRYGTSAEQLSRIIEKTAEMLRCDERVKADTVRVCFRGFGDWSLNMEIWAYVHCADWGRFLKIQEELFMKVMQIVASEGAAFALPSQITYLGSDRSPDRPDGASAHDAGDLPEQARALLSKMTPAG
ncbi:mechanosensitive ion channel family protein [Afifella pfennigii]|uniref:mechanosensitive ion channel family protein n=1 Tax=Afifella pfennigii TaxID=209897 RepID=UPI00146FC702|nr:mechanosensitive ion channel family protein [Afifella pfennigii]